LFSLKEEDGEEARETRKAFAGGHELQPWDWKSSTRVTGMGFVGGEGDDEGGFEDAIWATNSELVWCGGGVWKGLVKTLRRDFMV
jgi:hypothetical protein